MEKMSVIKRLAPNYWLGYYGVYMATLLFLCARHRQALLDWSDEGYLFTLAAIFAVSALTGVGLATRSAGVPPAKPRLRAAHPHPSLLP